RNGAAGQTAGRAHSLRRQVAALTQVECNVSASRRHRSERDQLDLFRALPGDLAPRDAQDLMAYPFFSLAKSKRITPIDFRAGTIAVRVDAVPEHGMATIWDADVLIWAASQIVEARDAGLKTSRLMAATPYEILTFVGRGTSVRDYDRLKAALDRLQSTDSPAGWPTAAPLLLDNEWKESVPIGLYHLQPVKRLSVTELVAIRPPERHGAFLDLNGYLPVGVPMLKRILALPGQTVCRTGDRRRSRRVSVLSALE